ncbi:MAG: tRNA uridine-5-carboxymethylaminomethyl(34) synthesis GTPase MnmE [Clostridia bacterium]|nr:tRNA uridine-5-carboxymethylaminomethyl(34) synthesis GTPase MnmE [Clostridia bacterium]
MMMLGDTIAAISTPRGKGGVALLRVSGPRAVEICERVFLPASGKGLSEVPARTSVYGAILGNGVDGVRETVDDGLATVFREPASFTGEDTVEICCHGGILLTETVLTSLISAGARAAEAGEFTRRAFVNGKMGLSSAEALGNLLEAQTHEQMRLAHAGTNGKLEEACREIYETLRDVLASIYVKIDYPDEDLADMSRAEIDAALGGCEEKLKALCATYRTGHAIAEGISTVICGRPNVGKSSLYNRIVGRDAAIVTAVEGTTRDVLCETAALGRVTLRLFDTAGLHDTADPVEQIGIARAREALDRAELVLAVFDGSRQPDDEELALIEELREHAGTVIAVINKSDLGEAAADFYRSKFAHAVTLSAERGEGMDALTDLTETLFVRGDIDVRRDVVLSNARQNGAALAALEAVGSARGALAAGLPIELCCSDAECAMEAIAQLDGRSISEDIVAQIFSHFCVGK